VQSLPALDLASPSVLPRCLLPQHLGQRKKPRHDRNHERDLFVRIGRMPVFPTLRGIHPWITLLCRPIDPPATLRGRWDEP
jgi:hypothetical protein